MSIYTDKAIEKFGRGDSRTILLAYCEIKGGRNFAKTFWRLLTEELTNEPAPPKSKHFNALKH